MEASLLIIIAFTFAIGAAVFRFTIPLAHRYQLVDVPNGRRRHDKEMPIIGGVSLLLTWLAGIILYSMLKPVWLYDNFASLWPIGVGVSILTILGLVDDLRGVGPVGKLFFQLIAATIVLAFEPKAHGFCIDRKSTRLNSSH